MLDQGIVVIGIGQPGREVARNASQAVLPDVEHRWDSGIWANEYEQGAKWSEDFIQTKFRKRLEMMNRYDGAVICHGMGCGKTSRIMEVIRDTFLKEYMVNVPVNETRIMKGPIEKYNSLFSLAWLDEFSDLVLPIDLDELQPNNDLSQMRVVAGDGVLSLFEIESKSKRCDMSSLVRTLTPLPKCKIAHGFRVQLSRTRVDDSVQDLLKCLQPFVSPFRRERPLALALAGVQIGGFQPFQTTSLQQGLESKYRLVTWNPYPTSWRYCKGKDKIISIGCNRQDRAIHLLSGTLTQAFELFKSRAFVHNFASHGFHEMEFVNCMKKLEHGPIQMYESI